MRSWITFCYPLCLHAPSERLLKKFRFYNNAHFFCWSVTRRNKDFRNEAGLKVKVVFAPRHSPYERVFAFVHVFHLVKDQASITFLVGKNYLCRLIFLSFWTNISLSTLSLRNIIWPLLLFVLSQWKLVTVISLILAPPKSASCKRLRRKKN